MDISNPSTRRQFLKTSGTIAAGAALQHFVTSPALGADVDPAQPERTQLGKPNIVWIMCDDLGYGDVHCLNPDRGKIPTPNLDRLAAQGMTFTDCHGAAAICTPSRYGVLTGRYSWRTHLQSSNLSGYDKPLIPPDRVTVPTLLKQHGYASACIGKWHLGWDWTPAGNGSIRGHRPLPPTGTKLDRAAQQALDGVDYRKPIRNGPLDRGFDSFFGLPASLDLPPLVLVENNQALSEPNVIRNWFRDALTADDLDDTQVIPTLVRKATAYVADRAAAAKQGNPFFLYLPLSSPHTPLAPTSEFVGKSGIGIYGDFVMETDNAVGEIFKALDAAGVADNTLVFFTSDHGAAPYINLPALNALGHFPSGNFRGYKFDIWEGGHRIPFFARWPGKIKPGSTCDQPICTTSFLATVAEILGATLPPEAGPDSFSILPHLLGQSDTAKESPLLVNHSGNGQFAIRQGQHKLAFCAGSGGNSAPHDDKALANGLPPLQLFDLQSDIGEQHNLLAKYPDLGEHAPLVKQMTEKMRDLVKNGRSTPGPKLNNDVAVNMQKFAGPA